MDNPYTVIRSVDPPPHTNATTTNYYHVELYVGGMQGGGWPQGLGTVVEYPGNVYLAYLFVIDVSRRKGYGRRIIEACIERWPDIDFRDTMDGSGRLLVESMGLGHLI